MITLVKRLHPDASLPEYGYPGDAGMDLAIVGDHRINPGESRDLPTGIAVQMPESHWGRITGRSSTLRKKGLFINEGVIDEGYRGELLVYVTNRNGLPVEVVSGERLAQLILQPIAQAPAGWSDELSATDRGTNGFGSTDFRFTTPVNPVEELHVHLDLTERSQVEGVLAGVMAGARAKAGSVYLGGSVDLGDQEANHEWRHSDLFDFPTYCPICECAGLTTAKEVIQRNMDALYNAPDAIFLLAGSSIGTPIEAWKRLVEWSKPGVLVWPRAERSVFVEYMGYRPGALIASDLDTARAIVAERIGAKVHGGT